MAMPIVENFEGLTLGDLSGQDSWTGGYTQWDIQNSVVHGGSKAVGASSAGGSLCEKDFGAPSLSGSQVFYFRCTAVASAEVTQVRFRDYGVPVTCIILKTESSNLQYYNGTSYQTIQAVSNNTWYKVQVDWLSNSTARYRVDDGTPTSYDTMGGTMTNGIDGVYLGTQNSGTVYFDDFEAPASSGPANLKSYNTNVLANIKSINTNLIANVKSLDTNV